MSAFVARGPTLTDSVKCGFMNVAETFAVTTQIDDLRRLVATARASGKRIGCVPTMGALHQGHMSLVERARELSDFVVVTIFVNPTQFAPQEDLAQYPRPLEADLSACRSAGVDAVFLPGADALYPPGFSTWVTVDELSERWEGASRPTHFRGVTTIVLKLLNIVQPDVACFGQKDFQQQAVLRRMVRDLDVPVEIVTCPTIREPDGLALSSRNAYLSADERKAATVLSRCLQRADEQLSSPNANIAAVSAELKTMLDAEPLVAPDYIAIVDPETLAPISESQPRMAVLLAARVGQTRLIDNCLVDLTGQSPSPSSVDHRP